MKMIGTIELIFAFVSVSVAVFLWFKTNRNRYFYQKILGPPGYPIVGNLFDFLKPKEFLNKMKKYAKMYGGVVKMQLGPFHKVIMVHDHKFLEFILTSDKLVTKSSGYQFLQPLLGNGLLTSEGNQWKNHRRLLTPAFNMLQDFVHIFGTYANESVQKLSNTTTNDVYPLIKLCTLKIIYESALGEQINEEQSSAFIQAVDGITKGISERALSLLKIYNFFHSCSNNSTQQKSLQFLQSQINSAIEKRQNQPKRKGKTFLDFLLEADEPLTKEEIRDEINTLVFEGNETTATGISFALYCLANNPQIQQKVYQEQLKLFGNNSQTPSITYSKLQQMKYLESVIKESLRLYPPVPIIGREIKEDVEYGDTIFIFLYGILRNHEYIDDPEWFKPSRYEQGELKFPYSYIPFSAGPRNCIGQNFAMLVMKTLISKIIRKFELAPAQHQLELVPETVLKSRNGIKINLTLRQ